MPKYRVIKKSWLNLADPRDRSGASPRLVKEGQIVDYDGPPGSGLEAVDDDTKARPAASKPAPSADLTAANRRIADLEAQLAAASPRPLPAAAPMPTEFAPSAIVETPSPARAPAPEPNPDRLPGRRRPKPAKPE